MKNIIHRTIIKNDIIQVQRYVIMTRIRLTLQFDKYVFDEILQVLTTVLNIDTFPEKNMTNHGYRS